MTQSHVSEDLINRRYFIDLVAPGDIAVSEPLPKITIEMNNASRLALPDDLPPSGASTPSANAVVVAQAARARQFLSNPPLSFSQINPTSPFHQFHSWFRDPRLLPPSEPEACTLATASMPSGRVSARVMYLKELDERGWVVYSNWGSKAGKGAQVFDMDAVEFGDCPGTANGGIGGDSGQNFHEGNRWAALTFYWRTVERQVRVEGLVETYWRTRERTSQIGAWASQQSKVLWSIEPRPRQSEGVILNKASGMENINRGDDDDVDVAEGDGDDGRSILENRVHEMESRFACTTEIPLPPFWGGVRIVPESVEFWQGRSGRLHDRFRYVRVHDDQEVEGEREKRFRWRIQRLSP